MKTGYDVIVKTKYLLNIYTRSAFKLEFKISENRLTALLDDFISVPCLFKERVDRRFADICADEKLEQLLKEFDNRSADEKLDELKEMAKQSEKIYYGEKTEEEKLCDIPRNKKDRPDFFNSSPWYNF